MPKRKMALVEQLRQLELFLHEAKRIIENPTSTPFEVERAQHELSSVQHEMDEIRSCFSDDNPLLERYWIPRSGNPVKIKDMTEGHAKNALAFVVDKIAEGYPVWVDKHGMFMYNPAKRRRPPVTIEDVNSIVCMMEAMRQMISHDTHNK